MRQLPLNVRLPDHAVFASFHAGPNEAAVACLHEAAAGRGPRLCWLWGARASGRSHLLQATVAAAHAAGTASVYLPVGTLRAAGAGVLEGMEDLALIALDDIDAAAGDPAWEQALLLLYERLALTQGRLVLSATRPPGQTRFALPDVASRFSTAAVFQLASLDDAGLVAALRSRAAWRGLQLPDEAAQYLLARVERDPATLFDLLDRLDQAALAAQRRLTVPFIRSVIESGR